LVQYTVKPSIAIVTTWDCAMPVVSGWRPVEPAPAKRISSFASQTTRVPSETTCPGDSWSVANVTGALAQPSIEETMNQARDVVTQLQISEILQRRFHQTSLTVPKDFA
jgi:hypothetical protein